MVSRAKAVWITLKKIAGIVWSAEYRQFFDRLLYNDPTTEAITVPQQCICCYIMFNNNLFHSLRHIYKLTLSYYFF